MLYLLILLAFVFFVGVAMTVGEGLWSNTITLVSVLLSGLLGILGGVPLGVWVFEKTGKDESFYWYFVFAVVWGVFFLSVLLVRLVADKISGTRMKFVPPLEMVAGPLMGLFVAVMFTSFAAFTLERLPLQVEEDWSLSTASDWQKSSLTYARAPFWNVLKNFAVSEGIESSFIPDSK